MKLFDRIIPYKVEELSIVINRNSPQMLLNSNCF